MFIAAVGVVEVGEVCEAGEEGAWVGGEGVEVEGLEGSCQDADQEED